MNNNDIFKKLRVALMLRDDQIEDILKLVDFRMSKAEIGNFFRSTDHPKFMECGDQVLRNFLNGLVIYLRGTKENPKNTQAIIASHKQAIKSNVEKRPFTKKTTEKSSSEKKQIEKKPYKSNKKQIIVEKVVFKNGKKSNDI